MARNQPPPTSPDFPAEWATEFRTELHATAAARIEVVTKALIFLEIALLGFDLVRLRMLTAGIDALVLWRVSFVCFLVAYFLFGRTLFRAEIRVPAYLAAIMFFASWVSVVLAPLSGDMAVYATAVLGIAALGPLPGWRNAATFILTSAGLAAALLGFGDRKVAYWLVNVVGSCFLGIIIEQICFRKSLAEFVQRKALQRQRERVDELLYNVFPQSVAASLKEGKRSVASHSEVTILFADVVGFTQLASRLLPSQLVEVLETLFGRFDDAARRHGIEKIKTIGDAYMAISGAPLSIERSVERVADFALEILRICEEYSRESGFDLALRVGIHTGPVVAGVIGSSRLCYDLWGDSVNLAQRLEAHGDRNLINVSEPVYHRLRAQFRLEDRGLLDLKGKGPTRTFALLGTREAVGAAE